MEAVASTLAAQLDASLAAVEEERDTALSAAAEAMMTASKEREEEVTDRAIT